MEGAEFLRPVVPELIVVWRGLEIVINNCRFTEREIIALLEADGTEPLGNT